MNLTTDGRKFALTVLEGDNEVKFLVTPDPTTAHHDAERVLGKLTVRGHNGGTQHCATCICGSAA